MAAFMTFHGKCVSLEVATLFGEIGFHAVWNENLLGCPQMSFLVFGMVIFRVENENEVVNEALGAP